MTSFFGDFPIDGDHVVWVLYRPTRVSIRVHALVLKKTQIRLATLYRMSRSTLHLICAHNAS